MNANAGADWEIVVDGKPRTYRDDPKVAREAARYLQSKYPKSDVSVRNYVTGEVLSLTGEPAVSWADRRNER
jgi:hypothetical protein